MSACIEITINVRRIKAQDAREAKRVAFMEIIEGGGQKVLLDIGISSYEDFISKARVARECDCTFTVTIP